MSVPFSGKEFTFAQPDGTALRVRGWGDQYHAVFETLNGYTVVEEPATGFYQYADVSTDGDDLMPTGARPRLVNPKNLGIKPGVRVSRVAAKAKTMEGPGLLPGTSRWEQRRQQFKQALRNAAFASRFTPAPPHRETVGDFVGLCLLIQFSDVPATITRDQVDDFCNKVGYAGSGNNGSVYDYFLEVSGGRLRYKNVVAPYYTAQHPRSYYTNEQIAQPIRARQLIKEALVYHKAHGFDFSGLSVDAQQYVYATNVFYTGTRVNNWAKGLWPHSYHLQTPHQLTPGKNAFDYQITDMTSELSLGTFCHENGHMICDFPDLYDYGYESAGVGTFCLMCAGPNADEKNPPQVGAYLKYKAGWAQSLKKITAGFAGTAEAGSNKFFIHRKGPTEYYIVENRFKQGRDLALPGSGLAIWRVDELGDNQNEQMSAALHYECSLVQADGHYDLENDPQNQGDATDLFAMGVNDRFARGTIPNSNWWDGTASGLDISAIGPAGVQMTFTGNI
ncbi:M6 family metalloprotease domain-containing protein [Planctopirus hydrillae]|uniref:Metalloprotease n=1 Tax=Planctopirus hydrillae TaxID=1841610 RepID=A0A1C3EU26_9PLAN|nr:M6 family metalloprotease domain-containing protein [Planctopirus hydrillae]ODA36634.1 metalloprotease [Planctopirus hydrillae]